MVLSTKILNFILIYLAFTVSPVQAYLDTTPKNFKKPKPLKVRAYKYKQSKIDKYAEFVTDKVASRVLSTVIGGPASAAASVTTKIIDYAEKSD